MSDISALLKKLRGRDSLREASKKTGISHNYISIIEKGVDPRTGTPINITPDTLKSYAKGYHYDYEELMIVAGHLNKKENDDSLDEHALLKKAYDNVINSATKEDLELLELFVEKLKRNK